MKYIKENYKQLDFLSLEFNFEYNDSKIYKTNKGAFLTSIYIISILILAFSNCSDIYKRKNPSVSSNTEILQESKIYLEDIGIFFQALDFVGNKYDNVENYFDIYTSVVTINSEGRSTIDNYPFVNCSQIHFNSDEEELIKNEIKQENVRGLCFNFTKETFLLNEYPNINSNLFTFNVGLCDINDSERSVPCYADERFIGMTPTINFKFSSRYVDNLDYKNPIKLTLVSKSITISDTLYKRHTLYYSLDQYHNDVGWLIENTNFREFVNYNYIEEQIDKNFSYLNLVASICLTGRNSRNKYVRSYMKLQDLFAKIGGFANALYIFMQIISYNYFRYAYLMFVKENTFNYLENIHSKLESRNANSNIKLSNQFSRDCYIVNNDNNKINYIRNNRIFDINNNDAVNNDNTSNRLYLDSHVSNMIKNNYRSNSNLLKNYSNPKSENIGNNDEIASNNFNYIENKINTYSQIQSSNIVNSQLNINNNINNSNKNNNLKVLNNKVSVSYFQIKENKSSNDLNEIATKNHTNLIINNKKKNEEYNNNNIPSHNKVKYHTDSELSSNNNLNNNRRSSFLNIGSSNNINYFNYPSNINNMYISRGFIANNKENNNNNNNKNNNIINNGNLNKIAINNDNNMNNPAFYRFNKKHIKEIKHITSIKYDYFSYLINIFCICYNKEMSKKIQYDLEKIKDIMDIRRFNRYLIKEYYLKDQVYDLSL